MGRARISRLDGTGRAKRARPFTGSVADARVLPREQTPRGTPRAAARRRRLHRPPCLRRARDPHGHPQLRRAQSSERHSREPRHGAPRGQGAASCSRSSAPTATRRSCSMRAALRSKQSRVPAAVCADSKLKCSPELHWRLSGRGFTFAPLTEPLQPTRAVEPFQRAECRR